MKTTGTNQHIRRARRCNISFVKCLWNQQKTNNEIPLKWMAKRKKNYELSIKNSFWNIHLLHLLNSDSFQWCAFVCILIWIRFLEITFDVICLGSLWLLWFNKNSNRYKNKTPSLWFFNKRNREKSRIDGNMRAI